MPHPVNAEYYRLRAGGAFNAPDRATFYGGDAAGYTDCPTRDQSQAA